jgi:hypothetical protein
MHNLWEKAFQSTIALFAITAAVAVVAAFVKMVIGLVSGNGWALVTFFQDLTENFFIVAVVVYITAVLTDYQNRVRMRKEQSAYVLRRVETIARVIGLPYGMGGQKDLLESPRDSEIVSMLTQKADAWRDLGTNYKELKQDRAKLDLVSGKPAFLKNLVNGKDVIVFRLLWKDVSSRVEVLYAAAGERKQRTTYMNFLVDDLAIIAATYEGKLTSEAERCRELAIGLIAWSQYTDAQVETCLAFDLVAPPGSEIRKVLEPYRDDLAEFARMTDPVKGLIACCDRVLKIIESAQNERVLLSSLFSSVEGALTALEFELGYAALLGNALARLLEAAVPTPVSLRLGPCAPEAGDSTLSSDRERVPHCQCEVSGHA